MLLYASLWIWKSTTIVILFFVCLLQHIIIYFRKKLQSFWWVITKRNSAIINIRRWYVSKSIIIVYLSYKLSITNNNEDYICQNEVIKTLMQLYAYRF